MVRTISLFLLFNLCSLASGMAQQGTYPIWVEYDSTFRAGALDIKEPVIAKRLLHLNYSQMYGTDPSTIYSQYYDTNDWRGDLYRRAGPEGFQISFTPLGGLMDGAAVLETYLESGRGFHLSDFGYRISEATGLVQYFWTTSDTIVKFMDVATNNSPYKLVGRPRFTDQALKYGGSDLYTYMAQRDALDPTATAILLDSMAMVRLGIGMLIDGAILDTLTIDTIAYAVLYRRYTEGQSESTCKCAISERFDTVYITREMYEEANVLNLLGYREVCSPYYDIGTLAPIPGANWSGEKGISMDSAACSAYCDSLYATLDPNRFVETLVEDAEFHYEVWSTGLVPFKFLNGRVCKHKFDLLVRGEADDYLQTFVDSTLSWPVLDTIVWSIGTTDEPKEFFDFRSFGVISGKLQRMLHSTGKDWPIWNNTYQGLPTLRFLSGDFDSTDSKIVQMFEPQPYGSKPIPVMYANPDSMDANALAYYYTQANVAYNSEYQAYTDSTQKGRFLDYLNNSFQYGDVGGNARAVDVARFRFRKNHRSHPVYQNVQVHGVLKGFDEGEDTYKASSTVYRGFNQLPNTPEDIIASAWLAMNSGAEGVVFSDFTFNGHMFGVIDIDNHLEVDTATGEYLIQEYHDRMIEYGAPHRWDRPNDSSWQLPTMWVGFKSRFNAVRTVMSDLHTIDSIVGWKNLLFEQEEISVHDTNQTFSDIPMLDTLLTRQAQRYARDGTGDFVDSTVYDPREKTYVEVTHFTPSWQDSTARPGSKYLLLTNRRTWPIDTTCYDSACTGGYGLGAIDVRRPVIRLVNHTGYLADSVVVEQVGTSWSDTAAYGALIDLPWHTPGQGALYRVTPIVSGVSRLGVAYNNAIHIENTATDSTIGIQVAVVERDSAIWLHTFANETGHAGEFLISDPADTVHSSQYAKRVANNTNPSIARDRTGTAWLVVWERCDSNRNGTVQALHINGPPDSILPGGGTRLQLSSVRSLNRLWKIMTPAVVGIDGGWLTAWGSPTNGIELAAVRNDAVPDSNDVSLVGVAKATTMPYVSRYGKSTLQISLDSICKFPTLAYEHRYDGSYQTVALAWQQGADTLPSTLYSVSSILGPYIMYKPIHVDLTSSTRPTLLLSYSVEHVSHGLPGCRFLHPSIAIDSLNLGVAFESQALWWMMEFPIAGSPSAPSSLITLRFRDDFGAGGPYYIASPWFSPAYYWGENGTTWQYPSLVEFPSVPKATLKSAPLGALTWFDTQNADQQYVYQYGNGGANQLVDGSWPTMMRANLKLSKAINSTGIIYRDTGYYTKYWGWGKYGTYFPARFISQQTYGVNPFAEIFSVVPASRTISAGFSVKSWIPYDTGGCDFGVVYGSLRHDEKKIEIIPVYNDHPYMFSDVTDGWPGLLEPQDAGNVARTSTFKSTDEPLTINRRVYRSPATMTWLNTAGIYDTVMQSLPDVKVLTELVLASNDSVLWRDDTLSVRMMSIDDTVNNVVVPTDEVYPEGTDVYVRVRPVVTLDVEYDLGAGFTFTRGSVPPIVAPKRAVQREGWESKEGSTNSLAVGALTLEAVPNPARDQAQLRLWSRDEGPVAVSIWSMKGEELQRLPVVEAEANGTYSVDIDVSNVRTGSYLVRAESAAGVVTVELRVMR